LKEKISSPKEKNIFRFFFSSKEKGKNYSGKILLKKICKEVIKKKILLNFLQEFTFLSELSNQERVLFLDQNSRY